MERETRNSLPPSHAPNEQGPLELRLTFWKLLHREAAPLALSARGPPALAAEWLCVRREREAAALRVLCHSASRELSQLLGRRTLGNPVVQLPLVSLLVQALLEAGALGALRLPCLLCRFFRLLLSRRAGRLLGQKSVLADAVHRQVFRNHSEWHVAVPTPMYENNLLKGKANVPFTCRDQRHDRVSQQEYD